MASKPDRIYVCFLCEAEFPAVAELSKHMKAHDKETADSNPLVDVKPKKLTQNANMSVFKNVAPKRPYFSMAGSSSNWKSQVTPTLKKADTGITKPNIKKPDIKVTAPKTEKELALQRALKIQSYIRSKENAPTLKSEPPSRFEGTVVDENAMNESDSAGPFGPTIITGEPEGFLCPTDTNGTVFINENEDFDNQGQKFSIFQEGSASVFASSRSRVSSKISKRGRPGTGKKFDIRFGSKFEDVNIKEIGEKKKIPINIPQVAPGDSVQCEECYKTFRSTVTLKIHMKSHETNKDVSCPFCEQIFPQRHILYDHLLYAHEELAAGLVCPTCGKIFTRPDSLKSHIVRMHSGEGGLTCVACGKHFPSQAQLEVHIRVHTGERPFKCVECGKGFVQKVHLKTHLKTMHNMTDMLTTPCQLCDEMLTDRTGLREHLRQDHSMNSAEYKMMVAKLKKEGRIPEAIPRAVKVVEPNFNYQKVSVTDIEDDHDELFHSPQQARSNSSKKMRSIQAMCKTRQNLPGMATIMDLDSHNMFTPGGSGSFKTPNSRNEEELKLVESAFKEAEYMDLMSDGSSLMVSGEEAAASNMFYSLPVVMNPSVRKVAPADKDTQDCNTLQELKVVEIQSQNADELMDYSEDPDFGEVSNFSAMTSTEHNRVSNIKVESL